jgi:integrase
MTNTQTLQTGRKPRRSTTEIPILTPEELGKVLQKAECRRDACMVSLLYLTGRRIGEVLPLRLGDFTLSDPRVISLKTFNEKSFRAKRKPPYLIERPERPGMFYEVIEPMWSREGPSGSLLTHYVVDYLDKLREDGDDYLFPPYRSSPRKYINQPRAYQILRAMDERLWLHAMRHIDFTRMADIYQDDPVAMHRLTFHKRFESTLNYIKNLEKRDKLAKL